MLGRMPPSYFSWLICLCSVSGDLTNCFYWPYNDHLTACHLDLETPKRPLLIQSDQGAGPEVTWAVSNKGLGGGRVGSAGNKKASHAEGPSPCCKLVKDVTIVSM